MALDLAGLVILICGIDSLALEPGQEPYDLAGRRGTGYHFWHA